MIKQTIALDGLRYYESGKLLAIRKWDGSRLEYKAKICDYFRQDIEEMDREVVVGQVFRNFKSVYVVGRPDVSPHFGCYEMEWDLLYTCRANTIKDLSSDLKGIKKLGIINPNKWEKPMVFHLSVRSGVFIKKNVGYFDANGKFVANPGSSTESV